MHHFGHICFCMRFGRHFLQNLADLGSHWGPFGEPLGALLGTFGVFFQGLIWGHFLVCFGEGSAAWAGSLEP